MDKKERKDYCGPWWMSQWMREKLSDKFNASCKIHDLDYHATTKFSRDEADSRFKKHMLRQAKDSKRWKITAHIYYLAVRLMGIFSYKRKE